MSSQYGGIEADLATVTIPDDNDVADSESVNITFRALKDSIRLQLATDSKQPIHHLVRMRSVTATAAVFSTIPLYIQNIKSFSPYQYGFYNGATLTFTAADLDTTPPVLAANTTYYCYIRWDNGSSTYKRHLSVGIPDETLFARNSDQNFTRYLGAFFTDGSANIIACHKSGTLYTYDPKPGLGTVVGNGLAHDFSILNRTPSYCQKVRLFIELYNTDPASEDGLLISAPGGPEQLLPIGPGDDVEQGFSVDLPLRGSLVRARTVHSTSKAEAIVRLEGMWES